MNRPRGAISPGERPDFTKGCREKRGTPLCAENYLPTGGTSMTRSLKGKEQQGWM